MRSAGQWWWLIDMVIIWKAHWAAQGEWQRQPNLRKRFITVGFISIAPQLCQSCNSEQLWLLACWVALSTSSPSSKYKYRYYVGITHFSIVSKYWCSSDIISFFVFSSSGNFFKRRKRWRCERASRAWEKYQYSMYLLYCFRKHPRHPRQKLRLAEEQSMLDRFPKAPSSKAVACWEAERARSFPHCFCFDRKSLHGKR